jgi:hypothetical protein
MIPIEFGSLLSIGVSANLPTGEQQIDEMLKELKG